MKKLILLLTFTNFLLVGAYASFGKIIAKQGAGYLENVDGTLVCHLNGDPYQLGYQHGKLLADHVKKMVEIYVHGEGQDKESKEIQWVLQNRENTYKRLEPFIPKRFKTEMQGLADGAGLSFDEIKYMIIFSEFFHCSGFALMGHATKDGTLYHGRILDYITDRELQDHAVVFMVNPKDGNAFLNVGFAGQIGSVTGMNQQHIAIGEMGGDGQGNWDGMPMTLLIRDALERANTLDEAKKIFKETKRTCEYYYVISDSKIPDAVGVGATPENIFFVKPGESNPRLPSPVKDCVLMSAGDRYKKLVERVKANYGKFDVESAIRLMDRPVAMKSALHTVLFKPATLEAWVAVAGSDGSPAPTQKYHHYQLNLRRPK